MQTLLPPNKSPEPIGSGASDQSGNAHRMAGVVTGCRCASALFARRHITILSIILQITK